MQEAAKGFRRLKAHKQLPALRATLEAHRTKASTHGVLARQADARVTSTSARIAPQCQQKAVGNHFEYRDRNEPDPLRPATH